MLISPSGHIHIVILQFHAIHSPIFIVSSFTSFMLKFCAIFHLLNIIVKLFTVLLKMLFVKGVTKRHIMSKLKYLHSLLKVLKTSYFDAISWIISIQVIKTTRLDEHDKYYLSILISELRNISNTFIIKPLSNTTILDDHMRSPLSLNIAHYSLCDIRLLLMMYELYPCINLL